MVGDNVQHLPQPRLAQAFAEAFMPLRTAQFRIHTLMIDHIIAMHTARRGLQIGRAIHVRHAKVAQIVRDAGGIVEGEIFMQLQSIR